MVSARLAMALAFSLSVPLAAQGQSAPAPAGPNREEAAYLAARDAAIAKIKRRDGAGSEVSAAQVKQEDGMLHDLETKLRRVIGPVDVEGFPPPGKSNIETLSSGDVEFGALDAIAFRSSDDKMGLYVTSEALFSKWLKQHEKWWEDDAMPQDPAEALRKEAFYTQSISSDAAFNFYKALPVIAPTTTLAVAQLEATSQDLAPPLPDAIAVSVIRKGRLSIFVAPLVTPFVPIAACEAINSGYAKKIQTILDAQAEAPNDKTMDESTRLQKEADDASMTCFKAHADGQPAFAAATKQAQALIDLVSKP